MIARNPMSQWHTCPLHSVPFRDEDGCPMCASGASPNKAEPSSRARGPWIVSAAAIVAGAAWWVLS
jgi:hypothetical protein